MTREAYGHMLDRLAVFLRHKPRTARAVAEALGCSRPVAYTRIQALRKREGSKSVYEVQVRESPTGPSATAYGVR